MFNFRVSPDLGIGTTLIRRIHCAYDGYLDQLKSVWKKGR